MHRYRRPGRPVPMFVPQFVFPIEVGIWFLRCLISNWLIAQTDHVRWLLVVPSLSLSLSLRMLLANRLVWILLGKPSRDRESFVIVVLIVHYSFWSRPFRYSYFLMSFVPQLRLSKCESLRLSSKSPSVSIGSVRHVIHFLICSFRSSIVVPMPIYFIGSLMVRSLPRDDSSDLPKRLSINHGLTCSKDKSYSSLHWRINLHEWMNDESSPMHTNWLAFPLLSSDTLTSSDGERSLISPPPPMHIRWQIKWFDGIEETITFVFVVLSAIGFVNFVGKWKECILRGTSRRLHLAVTSCREHGAVQSWHLERFNDKRWLVFNWTRKWAMCEKRRTGLRRRLLPVCIDCSLILLWVMLIWSEEEGVVWETKVKKEHIIDLCEICWKSISIVLISRILVLRERHDKRSTRIRVKVISLLAQTFDTWNFHWKRRFCQGICL